MLGLHSKGFNRTALHHIIPLLTEPMDFFATLYSIAFTADAESAPAAPSTPIDADRGSVHQGSGGCIIA